MAFFNLKSQRKLPLYLSAATCVTSNLLPCTTTQVSAGDTSQNLNILFIATDDLNDFVGAMGDQQAITPNLDRLAARGVSFNNAHASSIYSAPSRTSLMTGMNPSTTGCYRDQFFYLEDPSIIDLPGWFKNNGYTTSGTGKLYHHMHGCIDLRSWDTYTMWDPSLKKKGWFFNFWGPKSPSPKNRPLSPATRDMYKDALKRNPNMKNPLPHMDFGPIPNNDEPKMADTIAAQYAIDFLANEQGSKPFFLGVGFYAPHKPNFVPQKYFDMYPLDSIKEPPVLENDLEDLPPHIQKRLKRRANRENKLITEKYKIKKETIRGYLASVTYVDAQIGRVLDALDNSQYADSTIIVLWSDHGYHNGEKGLWAKHTHYERTSHVPFIWAGPGIAQNKTVNTTVSLLDIYPTLLSLAGLPENSRTEGIDLTDVLIDPSIAKDRPVLQISDHGTSVITQEWRYTRYNDGEEELYHLTTDPDEWYNIANKPANQNIIHKLAQSLPMNPKEPGVNTPKKLRQVIVGENWHWVSKEVESKRKSKKATKIGTN
ncbi:sulfatase [Planctomycetota bacterium]|nr:sulfatase [Planctomycetota bacterium]